MSRKSKSLFNVRYIVLQLGLAGPILQVTRTVFAEVRRIGTEKLREVFAEPAPERTLEQPHHARPASNSSEEVRRRGDLLAEKYEEK